MPLTITEKLIGGVACDRQAGGQELGAPPPALHLAIAPGLRGGPAMSAAVTQQVPHVVLYKIPEVMQMLRMSRGAVYSEINAGRLRRVKRGRSVFVTSAAIADYVWLLEQEASAAPR